jgi:hypothetical protein
MERSSHLGLIDGKGQNTGPESVMAHDASSHVTRT